MVRGCDGGRLVGSGCGRPEVAGTSGVPVGEPGGGVGTAGEVAVTGGVNGVAVFGGGALGSGANGGVAVEGTGMIGLAGAPSGCREVMTWALPGGTAGTGAGPGIWASRRDAAARSEGVARLRAL